jgi:hypothetical protein
VLFGVGSDARSASKSEPGPRTATHCIDKMIGRPTRVKVGCRLGLNRKPINSLVARGLDDEFRGTAFAVVDGIDGRVHHLKLPDIDAAGDGPIGGIVELRRFEDVATGIGSRLLAAPISILTNSWRRKGRLGSTGAWPLGNLLISHAAASVPRFALRSIGGSTAGRAGARPPRRRGGLTLGRNLN